MCKQIAKLIARIAENLPDMTPEVMQGWIDNPKGLQVALKDALCPPEEKKTADSFKVWKTIKLGTGLKIADDFRGALKQTGNNIGDWGNDILGKPQFVAAREEFEVDLVLVSNADLGFKDGAKVKDTFARAKELGLELCPNEVGPQLRLQYEDQPKGEWMLIGMEPIAGSSGSRGVFSVERDDDGERWLSASRGDPDDFWGGDDLWVFVRPRK